MMSQTSKAFVMRVTKRRVWLRQLVDGVEARGRGRSKVWRLSTGNRALSRIFMGNGNYPLGVKGHV